MTRARVAPSTFPHLRFFASAPSNLRPRTREIRSPAPGRRFRLEKPRPVFRLLFPVKPKLLLWAVSGELLYIASVRLLGAAYSGPAIPKELWWTALRLPSLAFLFWLLRSAPPAVPPARRDFPAAGLGLLLLLAPVLVADIGATPQVAFVFALTSLAVGFREELFYRGVLQRWLRERLGLLPSIATSNFVFLLYHWGVQPFTPANIVSMFFTGCVLGLLYETTGSLIFVGLLHALYDAVWMYSPFLPAPLPESAGAAVSVLLTGLLAWRITATRRPACVGP